MTGIHIYRPSGYYIGQTRQYGHRNWKTVTGKHKLSSAAMIGAIKKMVVNDKRARVLFFTEWYDPIITMELKL